MRALSRLMVFLVATCLAAGPAIAQSPAPTVPPTRVGMFNFQAALAVTQEGKRDFGALQTKYQPRLDGLKRQNDALEKTKQDLEASRGKLGADELARQARDIAARQKNLQRGFDDARNELQLAEQEVVNRIGTKMLRLLETYANERGYDVILDVSNSQRAVLWAGKQTNITGYLLS